MKQWIQAYRHFRVGGLRAATRYINELDHNHVHVISWNPPIVYLWWGRDDMALHQELADSNLTVMYLFPWCFDSGSLPAIRAHVNKVNQQFPRHKVIFLCNEEFSVDELRAKQLDAYFVHQNAFVNENIFRPRPGSIKTHDAVYSASMSPYKRHCLASKVNPLIIMTYLYDGATKDEYTAEVFKCLEHAWWAKMSTNDDMKISPEEIVDLYTRAHVGLCLSSVEGGMFVSMEYMLSGLPIVSTSSVGGRDAFWDDRYVIVCDDSADAVADAVTQLKEKNLDPEDVRKWTLLKISDHRLRMKELVQSLGAQVDLPWLPGSHGVSSWTNLRHLGKQLRSAN